MIVKEEVLTQAVEKALSQDFNPKRKFLQSVELVVTFREIDVKKGDLKLREAVLLPAKPSKERRVFIVPTFEAIEEAKKALPHMIMSKDDLQKLQGNKRAVKKIASKNHWFLISQDSIALAGRILGPAIGPRGKFPIPIPNNANVKELIERYKQSTLVRTKDQQHVQVFIGTEDQKTIDLTRNALAVLSVIEGKLKSPHNVRALYVKTDMGKPSEVKL
jgi:large subunit ribosomal protein L1